MNWKALGQRLLGALGAGLTTGIGAYVANPAAGWQAAAGTAVVTALGLGTYSTVHTATGSSTVTQ